MLARLKNLELHYAFSLPRDMDALEDVDNDGNPRFSRFSLLDLKNLNSIKIVPVQECCLHSRVRRHFERLATSFKTPGWRCEKKFQG